MQTGITAAADEGPPGKLKLGLINVDKQNKKKVMSTLMISEHGARLGSAVSDNLFSAMFSSPPCRLRLCIAKVAVCLF